MEYERIQKQQSATSNQVGGGGGGLSPAKLRAILLGGGAAEKSRRKDEAELEAVRFCFRSNSGSEIDSRRESTSDDCKDVDMVSSRMPTISRARSQDEEQAAAADSDAVRRHVPLFSKPAPSKWDDAQKWIASPGNSRSGKAGGGGAQQQPPPPPTTKRAGIFGHGSRLPAAKVVLEVTEDVDTKRVDFSDGNAGTRPAMTDLCTVAEEYSNNRFDGEKSITESSVIFNRNDSSSYHQCTTTFFNPPSSTAVSVSLRDIGTEMTPIASQEPSRTETPVGLRTPNRSPSGSQPSTPRRPPTSLTFVDSSDCKVEQDKELSEKELQMKTRKEIMVLGTKLGKTNIAAWASREEKDASKFPGCEPHQSMASIAEVRAAAWEEAEKTKYQARFKREEIKIKAWEDHQKAKIEAEIRKLEVDVERKKANAFDQLMKKQESIRHQAAGRRADAEARKNQNAVAAADQAEFIRRTGRVPAAASFACTRWCCW